MSDFLIYDQQGSIVTLTLNSPETRNALSNQEDYQAIVAACEQINHDSSVGAVILTGAGSCFCAGGNVKDMKEKKGAFDGDPLTISSNYRHGIQKIPLALYNLEAPTIAAVNGPAIGAGCDLTLMCDIRIASEKAKFAESFVQLGIIPGDGGAWLLQRAVGLSKAYEMAFTGDSITAREALECGLVSKCVAPDDLMAEARAMAERIVKNPPRIVRLSKKLMREGMHTRLDTLLEMSAAFQAMAHKTDEHLDLIDKISLGEK
ncbi:MAG: crotonase/enoyl-CoA hydratase family protein [Rhodospirillaceae bacterium]|jgi:enoyl-CoA hydratase/carnithine racemase|nr:crotonase/enoyl-CoA hydratase family protein [Rhodospirillaceae bacterium]MBT7266455.1 crotonase/enoyl-CoA hydratase family protein [Rhodospirillaceae bacterium]